MCELEEEEMFYAILDHVVDKCLKWDTLIVLGGFNATWFWHQKHNQFTFSELFKAQKDED